MKWTEIFLKQKHGLVDITARSGDGLTDGNHY